MGRMLARATSVASDQGEQAAKVPTSPEGSARYLENTTDEPKARLHYPHSAVWHYKGGGERVKRHIYFFVFFMPFIHIKDIFFCVDFVCSFFLLLINSAIRSASSRPYFPGVLHSPVSNPMQYCHPPHPVRSHPLRRLSGS